MRKIVLFFSIVLFIIPTQPVWAWGQEGHRIIGQIAYNHLNKKAKKHVDKVLGTHGIVYWSNWPDEIKSDTIYPDSYDWHFQDLDAGMTDEAVAATLTNYPSQGGKLWRITDSLFAVLEKEPDNFDVLRFYIHLLGDVFCPMHTAHLDDKGGNAVKLKWFGKSTNLHRIWDSDLIQSRGYSYSEYAEYLENRFAPETKEIQKMTKPEIVIHNYHLCNEIYAYQEAGDDNTYHYIYHFAPEMEWQLYAAGIRLAQLLNELY